MDEDPFNTDQPIKSESEISNQNLSVKFRMPLATAALIASIERLNTTTDHLPSKNLIRQRIFQGIFKGSTQLPATFLLSKSASSPDKEHLKKGPITPCLWV